MEKIEYRTSFGTIKQFEDVDELNVSEERQNYFVRSFVILKTPCY